MRSNSDVLRRPGFVGSVHVWAFVLLFTSGAPAHGQASMRPCPPANERTGQPTPACRTAAKELGRLRGGAVFWHLDTYPTIASARTAQGPAGTVVESLGRVWLFTVAEAGWRPPHGERVAEIGPLAVDETTSYTAVYLESILNPGTTAALHRHAGPEAFYVLAGGTCLETPGGHTVRQGPGHSLIVPGGPAMLLMAIGSEPRRGLALILHDSSQPATTMVHEDEWTPAGLCKQ